MEFAAIIAFIKLKGGTFPRATLSQRHFKLVPTWKRATIATRLLSHVLELHCNHHWYNFKYQSYKFMTQVFEAYCAADERIWSVCEDYAAMPEDVISDNTTPPRKKRTRNSFELSTPEHKVQPESVICVLSSSEEEAEVSEAPAAAAAATTPPPKKRKATR